MGGMEIAELDDMAWSALQEFGNWVAGTSATELSTTGVICDVTTPVLNEGESVFRSNKVFVTVPLKIDMGMVEVNVNLEKSE